MGDKQLMTSKEELLLVNRYRAGEPLADFGMGTACSAIDAELGHPVVIKLFDDYLATDTDSTTRFQKEADELRKLEHTNLLQLLDAGITDSGVPFSVYNSFRGKSLYSIIESDLPLSQEKIVRIMRQLCLGVECLHSHGILHSALSPKSILLGANGELKLIDYGLISAFEKSKFVDKNADQSIKFVHYMSPEHGRHLPLDDRSEVCVIACILYETITGEKIFSDEDPYAVVYKQVNEYPKRFAETKHGGQFDSRLESICWKALQKNPANRYQSVKELLSDINIVETDSRVSALAVDEYESLTQSVIDRDLEQIAEENLQEQKDSKLMNAISLIILLILASFVFVVAFSIFQNQSKPAVHTVTHP